MISKSEFRKIVNNNDPDFIEDLAKESRKITRQYFGDVISLYAPLYLSNFCDNDCVYCGFNKHSRLQRRKLTLLEMEQEMKALSSSGIQNILLLTGGSRSHTPPGYIIDSVRIARGYFPSISLEVYPMEVDEYKELFAAGVDGVTLYQETYDRDRYKILHLSGKKKDYNYRVSSPERIARAGLRMIGMGVLLGLSEVEDDIFRLFIHLNRMEKKFPGIEYSLSFPRLIPLPNSKMDYTPVTDIMMVKIICMARILFPRVGINLSTRERPQFRDSALMLGVTRMSASSKTCVGGYHAGKQEDVQFDVRDNRTVAEIFAMLKRKGIDPIFTEWRRIDNKQ